MDKSKSTDIIRKILFMMEDPENEIWIRRF